MDEINKLQKLTTVNKQTDTETKKPDKPGFRCGLRDHNPDTCIHKNTEYYYCKHTGHIRANLFALAKKEREKKKHSDVNTVDLEGECKDDYNLYTLQGRTQPPNTTYVTIINNYA